MSRHIRTTPLGRAGKSRPIQIVVTPSSGNGQALSTALALRSALTARRYRTALRAFDDLDRLTRWAKTVDGPLSLLVSVGGDGTQSAAAAAAMRRSVPFLPVSQGFGNLFARAFDHPRGVGDVLDLLAGGEIIHSDVGTRNGELFLCQESYGLIADVQQAVEGGGAAPGTRWQRWLAYYQAAARCLRDVPPTRLRVVVDGRLVAVDAALVIVANVEAYGAWLPLVPDASPVDGLLDVFALRAGSRREVLFKLLRRHLRMPGSIAGTLLCRGQRVRVSGLESGLDQLEVQPGALQVVVSPTTAARLNGHRARPGVEVPRSTQRVA